MVEVRHPCKVGSPSVFTGDFSKFWRGNTVTEENGGRGSKETALSLSTVLLYLRSLYTELAIRKAGIEG